MRPPRRPAELVRRTGRLDTYHRDLPDTGRKPRLQGRTRDRDQHDGHTPRHGMRGGVRRARQRPQHRLRERGLDRQVLPAAHEEGIRRRRVLPPVQIRVEHGLLRVRVGLLQAVLLQCGDRHERHPCVLRTVLRDGHEHPLHQGPGRPRHQDGGRGAGGYSLSDYIAAISNRDGATGNNLLSSDSYDPYMSQNWLSVLGYDSYIISSSNPSQAGGFYSSFGENADNLWEVQQADLYVHENGAIDKYNFSLATNISNTVFLGATLAVTDLNYHLTSVYDEDFGYGDGQTTSDHLYWDNYSSVDGTGYAFNLGVIVRPCDFLRLGVAYNSPTWYKITDYHTAEAGATINGYTDAQGTQNVNSNVSTPDGAYTEYRLRTSDRWIFSAAAILGQTALISVDYELSRYNSMHLSAWNGYDWSGDEL